MRFTKFPFLLIAFLSFLSLLVQAKPEENYTAEAIDLMVNNGRDIGPSLSFLKRLSNPYQLEAIDIIAEGTTSGGEVYNVSNKFPLLLKIDNPFAVRALAALVGDGRRIQESMPYIVQVKTEIQAAAVELLVQGAPLGIEYSVEDHFEEILQLESPLALEALRLLIQDHRDIDASFSDVVKVKNQVQLDAIWALVNGQTYDYQKYQVAPKMPHILNMDSELQLQALEALVEGGVGVRPSMHLIPNVSTPAQLELVRTLARYRTINKSIAFAFASPDELQMDFLKILLDEEVDAELFEYSVSNLDRIRLQSQVDALKILFARNYSIEANLQNILSLTNESQVKAMDVVTSYRLPLASVFSQILRIRNDNQVAALRKAIRTRPFRTFLARYFKIRHSAFKTLGMKRVLRGLSCQGIFK